MTNARGGVTAPEYNACGEVTNVIDAEDYETIPMTVATT